MISVKGFYNVKTTNKNTLEVTNNKLAKNEITPFTWYELYNNFPVNEGLKPWEQPTYNNIQANNVDMQNSGPGGPGPGGPDGPQHVMSANFVGPINMNTSLFNNNYSGLIISENTETYEEFKNFISNSSNAEIGLEYFNNYKKVLNSDLNMQATQIQDVPWQFNYDEDYLTANNIPFTKHVDSIMFNDKLIANKFLTSNYNQSIIKINILEEMLNSMPEEMKTSPEYLMMLDMYNALDKNSISLMISYAFNISDEEEYNISTLALHDDLFNEFEDLNFIKSYSKLDTPITKSSDEFLTIMYTQIVTIPLSTTSTISIDNEEYTVNCVANLSMFEYLHKNLNRVFNNEDNNSRMRFNIFSILESMLTCSAFYVYDVPGIAKPVDIYSQANERTGVVKYGQLVYDKNFENNSINSLCEINRNIVKIKDNSLKITIGGEADFNFYLASEYGIKAINYGYFVLEFDRPIKTKNPVDSALLENLLTMTSDTIPSDISFNTFNDSNLNYSDTSEKIIKLPAVNFNIPTSASNSDITNLKNIVNSYLNVSSGGDGGGVGEVIIEDMPR